MNVFKRTALLLFFLTPFLLSAQNTFDGTQISSQIAVDKEGTTLKWENGSYDYFVMFKSLLANNDEKNDCSDSTNCTVRDNPQGDTCLDSSTFTLTKMHVPEDASVLAAYLVWTGGIAPEKIDMPTDNSVKLAFSNPGSGTNVSAFSIPAQDVTASRAGVAGTSMNGTPQDFEHEGFRWDDSNFGYFTYRVNVTSFFNKLHDLGRTTGKAEKPGYSLYGSYTVSGVECTQDQSYIDGPLMSSSWSLIFVYSSSKINPKNVYIYNGFKKYQNIDLKATAQGPILVEGFKFPKEPTIKTTLMVSEGDPGLQYATNGQTPLPPEALSFRGKDDLPWMDSLLLHNKCNVRKETAMNPDMFGNMTEVPFPHVEVFSQISSLYGWSAVEPDCIGGDPNNMPGNLATLEYSVDVDTFRITNTSHDGNFANHLTFGDDDIEINISANQDLVMTNFLVVSVDTQPAVFDIPDEDEKLVCSCSGKEKQACSDRGFYYLIKVQNWGKDTAKGVKVHDKLAKNPLYKYVPGSTEVSYRIAGGTKISNGWEKVADTNGLSAIEYDNGLLLDGEMEPCDDATKATCDTAYVRFKVVQPDGIPEWSKENIIENIATIADFTGKAYSTNSKAGLSLFIDTACQPTANCADAELNKCGETFDDGTTKTCVEDSSICGKCEMCDEANKKCVNNPAATDPECVSGLTTNAVITVEKGINSPYNGNNPLIISANVSDLILGQFTLKAVADNGNNFEFKTVKVKAEGSGGFDLAALSNFRLVYDENGNGLMDGAEAVVGTAQLLQEDLEFSLTSIKYPSNLTVAFVILADVVSQATSGSFQASIPDFRSEWVSDDGSPTVETLAAQIKFAEYKIEPATGFVFTKGDKDPGVPDEDKINSDIEVMQFRTKAISEANKITSITIKANEAFKIFGEGIMEASLWQDSNKNGVVDAGEAQLGSTLKPDSEAFEQTFSGLNISYTAGEEKFLILKCKFDLSVGDKAVISVEKGSGVTLENNVSIYELPVVSKTFEAYTREFISNPECPEYSIDEACPTTDDGCGCTVVGTENSGYTTHLIMILMALFAMLAMRKILAK